MRKWVLVGLCGCFAGTLLRAQTDELKIGDVMSPKELQDTGVVSLTPVQRNALDVWLNLYTFRVFQLSVKSVPPTGGVATIPRSPFAASSCSLAIESTISGDIKGWDGDTQFKLDNGQIWQQATTDYTSFYSYRPDVTIYQTNSGCRMKVDGKADTVLVKRVR